MVSRRWVLPKTNFDRISMCVFTFGGILLFWYEAIHIIGFYHKGEWTTVAVFNFGLAVFVAVNIYGNMFMLCTTDMTGKDEVFPTGSKPDGWNYCDVCIQNSPPRSHHCKICNVCVLKRDHHCWFAGSCIGYHNHRYYFIMVIYMVLSAIYSTIYNMEFVHSVKGDIGFWNILSYVAPHVGLFFGYYDFYTTFITGQTSIGMTILFLFSWLLQMQVMQLLRGQTKYERKYAITKYNLGLRDNIVSIFGTNWYMTWVFPWIPSPLPGDGISFRTTGTKSL